MGLHRLELPWTLERLVLELPPVLLLLLRGREQMDDLFAEERMRAEFRETDAKLVRLYETAIAVAAVSLYLSLSLSLWLQLSWELFAWLFGLSTAHFACFLRLFLCEK